MAKASAKPRSKSEIFTSISDKTGLSRKQISTVFSTLSDEIKRDLSKGSGVFNVAGMMKITVIRKPATKASTRPNPFAPGEMMQVKAKPARKVVKIRPLKSLKEMV